MTILPAKFPQDLEILRGLFRQYEQFLGISLCFQDFEAELNSLPGKYAPPMGGCWIEWHEDKAVGCVAIRLLEGVIAEVKRLYVLPEMAGQGIGRKLMQRAISEARIRNYHTLYLDTLTRLQPALQLYQSLGFKPIAPYNEAELEDLCYLKLAL
jgi:GNAT superfamily N-acetyltransferase